jgi:hypothetical protein
VITSNNLKISLCYNRRPPPVNHPHSSKAFKVTQLPLRCHHDFNPVSTMEHPSTSEFPHYTDGDVAIIVAPHKPYQLHSNILRRYSHYFAEVLDEEEAAKLSPKARKDGITTRYRMQLVKAQFGVIGTFQRLVSTKHLLYHQKKNPVTHCLSSMSTARVVPLLVPSY